MDCRTFRAQHLAYLDDTLPGDSMADAQRHLMACDACAAHDTLVRRSLVLARNHCSEIAPSDAFRARLEARLAECRTVPASATWPDEEAFLEPVVARPAWRSRNAWLAMAAGVGVVVTVSLQGRAGREAEPELPPVLALAPAPPPPVVPPVSPAMVRALSTGNPMWSVVQLLDEMPAQAFSSTAGAEFASYAR